MATVCLALFLMLTAVKLVAGVVLYRRRRRRAPAAVLVLGVSASSAWAGAPGSVPGPGPGPGAGMRGRDARVPAWVAPAVQQPLPEHLLGQA
jgi:hypothetical protein